MKTAYTLLFDGYADWEIGYILPELRRMGGFNTKTVGFNRSPVTAMGGLSVNIDYTITNIPLDNIAILIIPGGKMWEEYTPGSELLSLFNRLAKQKTPIAGICSASALLVKSGLCHDHLHTSNSLKYLKETVPNYQGQNTYVDALSIRDNHIITASGLGAIDFSLEIMNELEISSPETRTIWYNALKYAVVPESMA